MRVRHTAKALPRKWAKRGSGIIHEADLRVWRHSKIVAKLLVFENRRALRRFWKDLNPPGVSMKGACGVVSRLATYVIPFQGGEEGRHYLAVDPRYFCMIGLAKGWLSMEILTHEALHAAFAYQDRTRRVWDPENGEENLAYPTGRIAAAMLGSLSKAGLVE